MLHNEDRELQIRLAQLQTDVQFYLASLFGFLAVFMAVAMACIQLTASLPTDATWQRLTFTSISFFWSS
jgi:hypothetical protein